MSTRLAFAAAFVLGVAATACGHGSGSGEPSTSVATAPVASDAPAAIDGPSLYALHPVLRDQDGARVDLDLFRGHPVLVSMFYGSCPSACPLLVSNVARVDAQLPAAVRARTRVVLVSFDAEHDGPDALRAVAARHHLDLDRWRLAAAPDDDARELAAALGIAYRRLPAGGFAHTSVITALDGEGRIVARAEGPDADLAPVAAALIGATR
jgi:protein SCO1/2